jgi:hypothetical protein
LTLTGPIHRKSCTSSRYPAEATVRRYRRALTALGHRSLWNAHADGSDLPGYGDRVRRLDFGMASLQSRKLDSSMAAPRITGARIRSA